VEVCEYLGLLAYEEVGSLARKPARKISTQIKVGEHLGPLVYGEVG